MLGIHIAKELHCARGLIFIKRTKAITVSIQKQTSTMQIDETISSPQVDSSVELVTRLQVPS